VFFAESHLLNTVHDSVKVACNTKASRFSYGTQMKNEEPLYMVGSDTTTTSSMVNTNTLFLILGWLCWNDRVANVPIRLPHEH
jgi:hypothetical protein